MKPDSSSFLASHDSGLVPYCEICEIMTHIKRTNPVYSTLSARKTYRHRVLRS